MMEIICAHVLALCREKGHTLFIETVQETKGSEDTVGALRATQTECRRSSRRNVGEKWLERDTRAVGRQQSQWMIDAAGWIWQMKTGGEGECLTTYSHLLWKDDKWLPFTEGARVPSERLPCGSAAISSVLTTSLHFCLWSSVLQGPHQWSDIFHPIMYRYETLASAPPDIPEQTGHCFSFE